MGKLTQVLEEGLRKNESTRFNQFYDLLIEWNEKMNLTGIVDKEEVYIKHFWDSLMIREFPEWKACEDRGGTVIDIGTGAGFPGIPLAICSPTVHFVLCDSLNKRLNFLKQVVATLGLDNVELIHGRAEDLGRQESFRGRFDLVVSRAVARLNLLLELTAPFAKVEGTIVAYKGPSIEDERHDGLRAAELLGCELERIEEIALPNGMGMRSLVVIKQTKLTPGKYPRKAGIPQKEPL